MQENNKQVAKADQWHQHSKQLMQCLVSMELAATTKDRNAAKMELVVMSSELLPNGVPCYRELVNYKAIVYLVETEGRKTIIKAVYLLVKDFCESLNVVRNMNNDQMIEAAAMLVDECGDFRLEDYMIMFTLAKREQLVKIMDRIDISLIGKIMDAYYHHRREAGIKIQEQQFKQADNGYNDKRVPAPETEEEKKMSEQWGKLAGVMTAWKKEDDAVAERARQEKRRQQVQGYAKLQGIDLNQVVKEAKKLNPRKKKEQQKPSDNWK